MTTGGSRIVVLAENTAGRDGLVAEHGLSLWLDLGAIRVLFDTGQGPALAVNAQQLGIDLTSADAIVLSHGHYDHTGGLGCALAAARRPRLYLHPDAFGTKFARNADGTGRDIGLPGLDERAVRDRCELLWTRGPTDVCGGLRLTGEVPRVTDFEDTGGPFFTDAACTRPDRLADDQAAFLDTPAGTVVLLGCAHAGLINTLHYIRELTAGSPIHTVVGGTHLRAAGPERMDRTVAELRALGVRRLLPCHCTGPGPTTRLRTELPDRCAPCAAGSVVDLPA